MAARIEPVLLDRVRDELNEPLPAPISRLNDRLLRADIGSLLPRCAPTCSMSYAPGEGPSFPIFLSRFELDANEYDGRVSDFPPMMRCAGVSYAPGPGVRSRPIVSGRPAHRQCRPGFWGGSVGQG